MPQRFDELCRIFPPESEGKQCRSAVSQGHSLRDVFTTLEQKGLHHKSRKKRELRSQIYAARRRSNTTFDSIWLGESEIEEDSSEEEKKIKKHKKSSRKKSRKSCHK